jgi:hypothetical protein
MAIPGLRHSPLPAPWPPRGCQGGQAQIVHALSGVVEACEVTQCGHRGDRYDALHAAQGLERFDHGMETPGCDVFVAFLFEPLQTFRVLVDGADLCLEHDVRRRGRTDYFREPPEVGRVPGGWACIASVVPQQKGFQTQLRGLQVLDGIFPCAAQVADGFIFSLGPIDGRKVPGPHQPGSLHGITAVGFHPVPRPLRNHGGGHDPTVVPFFA